MSESCCGILENRRENLGREKIEEPLVIASKQLQQRPIIAPGGCEVAPHELAHVLPRDVARQESGYTCSQNE